MLRRAGHGRDVLARWAEYRVACFVAPPPPAPAAPWLPPPPPPSGRSQSRLWAGGAGGGHKLWYEPAGPVTAHCPAFGIWCRDTLLYPRLPGPRCVLGHSASVLVPLGFNYRQLLLFCGARE